MTNQSLDSTMNFVAHVEPDHDGTISPASEEAMSAICDFIDTAGAVGCNGTLHARCVIKMIGKIMEIPFPHNGVTLFSHLESCTRLFLVDNKLNVIESFRMILDVKLKADKELAKSKPSTSRLN